MKLAQIPKEEPKKKEDHTATSTPVVEHTRVDESLVEENDIHVYGLDPSDPEYQTKLEDLKRLKKRDPALFRKLQSMD